MNRNCLHFVFLVACCCSVKLVSSCSQEEFDVKAKACVNDFFSRIRQDPKQDCSSPYGEMKNCINLAFYECKKNSTDSKLLTTIATRAQKTIASETFYCEDGMLNSLKGFNLPDCRKKAIKKAKKCAASFHKKFSEDRASPSLCRKYTKAKACIKRALGKYCKKTERVEHILGIYQDPFNPYCPGSVDAQKKPVRSTSSPFGICTKREYLTLTRPCMAGFVQVLQKNPKKSCRSVFTRNLHNCAKAVVLYCHKNESKHVKQNIEKSFSRNRPFQERRFCDGINFRLSFPTLKHNQCEQNFFLEKHKCEESYVKTYQKNKADKSLCRKYAEAKQCAKNVTLALCKNTPQLRDEVNFIYDPFNPFCSHLSDPPFRKGPGERFSRESGAQLLTTTSAPNGRRERVSSGAHAQAVNAKLLILFVALGVLVLRASVS